MQVKDFYTAKDHIRERLVKFTIKAFKLLPKMNRPLILDVGCGYSSPFRSMRLGSYKVGLDFYEPYISKSKTSSIHNDYVLGDEYEKM